MTSRYRFSPALAVRLMGVVLAAAGLLVLAMVVLGALLGWPAAVLSGTVLVMVVATVAGLGTFSLLVRRRPVVRLDDDGYVVHWVRGVGVPAGRWSDVEEVVAATTGAQRCLVLRRRDGDSTTVPVGLLARGGDALARDVATRLAAGHRRR